MANGKASTIDQSIKNNKQPFLGTSGFLLLDVSKAKDSKIIHCTTNV